MAGLSGLSGVLGLSGLMGINASKALYKALSMPPNDHDVTLEYIDASNRYVWTPIWDRYWTRWQLELQASGFWALDTLSVMDVIKAWNDDDAGNTYNGAGWGVVASPASLGAQYQRSRTLNDYVEFSVTPGAGGKIYIVLATLTNGGYGAVTIDGGTDLVNELPLVGGYRQINSYAAVNADNTRILIAAGLDPATAYTVRLTVVDDRPPGSSDDYINFEGYGVFTTTIDDAQLGTVLYDAKTMRTPGYGGSAFEYAYEYKPTGAINYEWTGSQHGNENISGVTFEDQDGNDISVSAVDTKNHGEQVVMEHTATSRHGETGATDHANVICRATFDSAGVTVYYKHTWLSAATFDAAYAAMFPMRDAQMTRGHVAGDDSTIYTLNADDDSRLGQQKQRLAALWDASYPWVAWLYLPDLVGVNYWLNATQFMFIEDRVGGTINKLYAQRVYGPPGNPNASAAIGDVWESTAYYRVSYIENPETAVRWD
jgi:hypothetical protein